MTKSHNPYIKRKGTKFISNIPEGAGRVVCMQPIKDYVTDTTVIMLACEYAIYKVFPDRIEFAKFVEEKTT